MTCEGFTVKSLLKNAKVVKVYSDPNFITCKLSFLRVKVVPPAKVGAFDVRPSKPTAFRKFYLRGDFPIALEHDTKGNKIAWKVSSFEINYSDFVGA